MRHFHIVLAAATLLGAACSSDTATSPPPTDHAVQGSWEEDTNGGLSPGNSFAVALNESSGVVSGTGSFTGEAGPFGTLAVSGTIVDDSLHLRIVFVANPTTFPQLAPDTAQFAGALIDANHIQGQLTIESTTEPLNLVRTAQVTAALRAVDCVDVCHQSVPAPDF